MVRGVEIRNPLDVLCVTDLACDEPLISFEEVEIALRRQLGRDEEGGENGGGCTVKSGGPKANVGAAMSVYEAVDASKAEEVIINVGGGDRLRGTEDEAEIDDRVVLGVAFSESEYDIGSEWAT